MTSASQWWPSLEPRPPLRRRVLRYLLILGVPALLCVGGLVLYAVYHIYDSYDSIQEGRAEAQIRVEEQAHAYARTLIRNGDPEVSEESLDELAGPHSVRVIEVDRSSRGEVELAVLILSSADYYPGPFFGASSYARACYELVFAGLGTDDARYGLATIDPCPR